LVYFEPKIKAIGSILIVERLKEAGDIVALLKFGFSSGFYYEIYLN